MKIIPSAPGPDDKGRCCGMTGSQLCTDCPWRLASADDPLTSIEAAEYMSAKQRKRIQMNKVLLVFYKTGKEMNAWDMLTASQGTIDPDSCYWHRCRDLVVTHELEYVTDRFGDLVLTPGRTGLGRKTYRISEHGEAIAKTLS